MNEKPQSRVMTFYLGTAMIEKIKGLAEAETTRKHFRVTSSSIVRQVLADSLFSTTSTGASK